jgi:spore germination protein YaaH
VRDNPLATTTSWEETQRLIQSFGVEIQRDPVDMEARIEFKARGLPKRTIYFADSAGIEYKLQGVLDEFPQLGGVAIWGIGGEDPANWDVLRAARQANCTLTT